MYSFVVAPGRQGVIGQSLGVVMEGGGDLQCKVVSLSTGQGRLLEAISTTPAQCSTADTNMQCHDARSTSLLAVYNCSTYGLRCDSTLSNDHSAD
jgi:hypothetical protein